MENALVHPSHLIIAVLFFAFSCTETNALDIQMLGTKGGTQHYLLSGKISDGEHKKVIKALKNRDTKVSTMITLNSKGGNLQSAMYLGRYFRKIGVGTRVMDNCFSACTLIALGGFNKKSGQSWRQVHSRARFGVHRFKDIFEKKDYNSHDMHIAVEMAQNRIWRILKFLRVMEVPPEFLEMTLSVNSNGMRFLSPRELKQMKFEVVNSR